VEARVTNRLQLRRPALGLVILAAHLGLALLLNLRPGQAPQPQARLQLRLIPAERPAALPPSQSITPPPPALRALPRPSVPPPAIVLLPPVATEPVEPAQRAEPAPVAAPLAEAPASAPQPLLLHTEATRRAVREAARNPPLAVVAQTGLPQRETRDQRLARTMSEAGRGDCGKGEYAGGGMGLLSLPFWIAAEVRGQCAK
jgi:pyruvate/2-oxoglutarate dehydrogenase complex dihydrolipoamide acyltransferase (E2) component